MIYSNEVGSERIDETTRRSSTNSFEERRERRVVSIERNHPSRKKTEPCIWASRCLIFGGTQRDEDRSSDLGINCKLVYRPQRTLGCWFIRRVVAAFASSPAPCLSLPVPFNSGSPVPSRPSQNSAPGRRRNLPSFLPSRSFHGWKLQEISLSEISSSHRTRGKIPFNSKVEHD